jgi:dephospho-CoA kinase
MNVEGRKVLRYSIFLIRYSAVCFALDRMAQKAETSKEFHPMLKVGLTGGIASGKTTVCQSFARLGAKVFDVDQVARQVVQPGHSAWRKLQQVFGPDFFCSDGSLDRNRMRSAIFADPEQRHRLNEIVHPEVTREIHRRAEQLAKSEPDAVLVVDAPLLIEVGAREQFDRVVVVYVDENTQVERLVQRDTISAEEARQALKAQIALQEKASQADYIIDNSGTLEETQTQVEKVWQQLLELARSQGRTGD